MLAEFSGVLLFLVIGCVLAGALIGEKHDPFECGEKQIVSPHQRFSVKFYLVAILFVIFDIEALFFYAWGALFGQLGWHGYVAMLVFAVPLVVGLVYEWMKGALEW